MMVEQENIEPIHVIENSNAFSTPQTPSSKGKAQVVFLRDLTLFLVLAKVSSAFARAVWNSYSSVKIKFIVSILTLKENLYSSIILIFFSLLWNMVLLFVIYMDILEI